MSTLGYFQLKARPGYFNLHISSNQTSNYKLLESEDASKTYVQALDFIPI